MFQTSNVMNVSNSNGNMEELERQIYYSRHIQNKVFFFFFFFFVTVADADIVNW